MHIDDMTIQMFDSELADVRAELKSFESWLSEASADNLKRLDQSSIQRVFSSHIDWAETVTALLDKANNSLAQGRPNVPQVCEILRMGSLTIQLLSAAVFQATAIGLEIPKMRATRRGENAANARHGKPGGSLEKQETIRALWASGKYSTRDICAEQECAALNMSFSSARKALQNTPKPT